MRQGYRVGVIGCGRVAQTHAKAYQTIASTQLVAAADPQTQPRSKFGETYNISTLYADYREMLQREMLDIVSICTWPTLHCEITIAAAKSGVKGVVCEKPMALSLGECDQMLAACDASGTKLVIGHQHRYDPQAVAAINLIRDNAIGNLQWIFGYCNSRDLLSNGTHVVDLMRYFADDSPITSVMGQIDRPTDKVDFGHRVEHSAVGHWWFENGVRGFIEQGEVAPPGYAFQLCGTAGLISVNSPKGYRLRVITTEGELDVALDTIRPHQAVIEDLIEWLEGGPPHRSRGENGRTTMEVLMAIMESSRLRQAIQLPLTTMASPLELMTKQPIRV